MLSIDDLIKLLEKSKEQNAVVKSIDCEPNICTFESLDGIGKEIIKYNYTIELEYEQDVRRYKNKGGFREYIK